MRDAALEFRLFSRFTLSSRVLGLLFDVEKENVAVF